MEQSDATHVSHKEGLAGIKKEKEERKGITQRRRRRRKKKKKKKKKGKGEVLRKEKREEIMVMRKVGKYEVGRTIGEGTFAKVKFAQNSETGESVAMKILDKEAILKHKMVDQVGFSLCSFFYFISIFKISKNSFPQISYYSVCTYRCIYVYIYKFVYIF